MNYRTCTIDELSESYFDYLFEQWNTQNWWFGYDINDYEIRNLLGIKINIQGCFCL